MSGHSKWSQIKRQKGVADVRRGQLFSKLSREITVAARQGSDPEANFRLRLAVQRARDHNMPLENTERAIKRGTGETGGAALTEVTLEGYGPNGTAILVEAMTDNRNRTLQEVRNAFSRGGGSLGESGCVAWLFDPKGVIIIETDEEKAEELALEAIDAGSEDVKIGKGYLEIQTKPQELEAVRRALEQKSLTLASVELAMVPKSMVELEEKAALQTLRFLDRLEELDDVQRISSNADFSDAVVERYRSQT